MDTKFTPGPWNITHWRNGMGNLFCVGSIEGVMHYQSSSVHSPYYGIRSSVDPLKSNVEGSFEGMHICNINDFRHLDGSGDESKANAHLIAAAPELLEALISMMQGNEEHPQHEGNWWSRSVPSKEALIKAKSAIKKATEF